MWKILLFFQNNNDYGLKLKRKIITWKKFIFILFLTLRNAKWEIWSSLQFKFKRHFLKKTYHFLNTCLKVLCYLHSDVVSFSNWNWCCILYICKKVEETHTQKKTTKNKYAKKRLRGRLSPSEKNKRTRSHKEILPTYFLMLQVLFGLENVKRFLVQLIR